MKIAFITNDEKTISEHFGRASKYQVLTIEDQTIISTEIRNKLGHNDFIKIDHEHEHDDSRGHGCGKHSENKHTLMFKTIQDCGVLIVRGMGKGAYLGLINLGIEVIVSDIEEINNAAEYYIKGKLVNYKERLH